MDPIERLQDWFATASDGSWEHQSGIRIESLDNPGWAIYVDVAGTPLESRQFREKSDERSPDDWIQCKVTARTFQGYGGARNLVELIEVFLDWAGADKERSRLHG